MAQEATAVTVSGAVTAWASGGQGQHRGGRGPEKHSTCHARWGHEASGSPMTPCTEPAPGSTPSPRLGLVASSRSALFPSHFTSGLARTTEVCLLYTEIVSKHRMCGKRRSSHLSAINTQKQESSKPEHLQLGLARTSHMVRARDGRRRGARPGCLQGPSAGAGPASERSRPLCQVAAGSPGPAAPPGPARPRPFIPALSGPRPFPQRRQKEPRQAVRGGSGVGT